MTMVARFGLALALSGAAFAQSRGFNPTPFVTGSFGNVVFPAGNAGPGVHRSFPNIVNPGGGGPRLVVPGSNNDPTRLAGSTNFNGRRGVPIRGGARSGAVVLPYPVPIYVGSGYDFVDNGAAAPPPPADYAPQQQPPTNIIVIYPQQPQQPANTALERRPEVPPAAEAPAEDTAAEPAHYLFAFKDHTIYSAVAYWVDGDTLHYFTTGNMHNQVSLSLLDRDLTDRLNRESGINLQLPR